MWILRVVFDQKWVQQSLGLYSTYTWIVIFFIAKLTPGGMCIQKLESLKNIAVSPACCITNRTDE